MRVHALSQCAFSVSGVGCGAKQYLLGWKCARPRDKEGGRERDKEREREKERENAHE